MKVKELAARLAGMPQDAEVLMGVALKDRQTMVKLTIQAVATKDERVLLLEPNVVAILRDALSN